MAVIALRDVLSRYDWLSFFASNRTTVQLQQTQREREREDTQKTHGSIKTKKLSTLILISH